LVTHDHCGKLVPLKVNLDRITVGDLTRICVRLRYAKLSAYSPLPITAVLSLAEECVEV